MVRVACCRAAITGEVWARITAPLIDCRRGASNGVRRGLGLIVLRRSMKSRTIGGVRWGSPMATQDNPPNKISELPLTAFELPKWLVEPAVPSCRLFKHRARFRPLRRADVSHPTYLSHPTLENFMSQARREARKRLTAAKAFMLNEWQRKRLIVFRGSRSRFRYPSRRGGIEIDHQFVFGRQVKQT
jgi:hypothetical protein